MDTGIQPREPGRPTGVSAEIVRPAATGTKAGGRIPLRGAARRAGSDPGGGDAPRSAHPSRGALFSRPDTSSDSRLCADDDKQANPTVTAEARSPDSGSPPASRERAAYPATPLEVIPDWLRTPDPTPIHGAWRADAALVLDRQLLRLVSMESRARLVQAGLAAKFLDGRLWHDASFVRLADYAAERLGLTARTLQEDARVARALASLPLLRSAFLDGAISWTHLRLLIVVAEPSTQEEWIGRALSTTTRVLEALVRERKLQMRSRREAGEGDTTPQPDAVEVAAVAPANACASTDVDGSSVEPANACAPTDAGGSSAKPANACAPTDAGGSTAEPANACASVDAGGSSAEPANACASPKAARHEAGSTGPRSDADPADATEKDPNVRWATRASRGGRCLWHQAHETAERSAGSTLTQAQVLELVAAEAMAGRPAVPTGQPFPRRQPEPSARERSAAAERAFFHDYGSTEGFPWVDPPRREPQAAVELDCLLHNLESTDAHEIDRRLRELRAAMQRIDWQIGTVLRVAVGRRLYRDLGFATMELYVESRLGMSYRKASFLVNLERKSWSATADLREAYREGRITPLKASAVMRLIDVEHGPAWIQRATEVTFRRLTDEVTWALNRIDLSPPGHSCAPPPHDLDVRAEIFSQLEPADLQMRAHADFDASAPASRATVAIEMEVPASIAKLVEEALSAVRRDWEPRWRTFERMVALAVLEWTSVPRHRDPVFARDGWCCSVPACRSRRNLHDHHIEFRSHGGSDALTNRTSVCAAHHNQGLHGNGTIHAEGEAPHAIIFELGCRPGREPLLRTLGDRYLVSS